MSVSDFLRDQLTALKDIGCVKAKVTFGPQNTVTSLEVEFPPAPVKPTSAAPFLDASGQPVDLDAGMPALARDPDAEPQPSMETADAGIEKANFGKRKAA